MVREKVPFTIMVSENIKVKSLTAVTSDVE